MEIFSLEQMKKQHCGTGQSSFTEQIWSHTASWLRQPPNFTTEKTALKPWQDVTDTNPMFLRDVKYLKQKIPMVARQTSLISAFNRNPGNGGCWKPTEVHCGSRTARLPCLRVSGTSLTQPENHPDGSLGPAPLHLSCRSPWKLIFYYKRHGCLDFQWRATFRCVNTARNPRYLDICACFNICETNVT